MFQMFGGADAHMARLVDNQKGWGTEATFITIPSVFSGFTMADLETWVNTLSFCHLKPWELVCQIKTLVTVPRTHSPGPQWLSGEGMQLRASFSALLLKSCLEHTISCQGAPAVGMIIQGRNHECVSLNHIILFHEHEEENDRWLLYYNLK